MLVGFLRFEEKLTGTADREAVVWRLSRATDLHRVFVDNILVGFGITGGVVHIPAQSLEQRVEKLNAGFGFVEVLVLVSFAVALEPLHQFKNFFGRRHIVISLDDWRYISQSSLGVHGN